MRAEIQLFNAVCRNKDINTILGNDVQKMIISKDIYDSIVTYWHKYGSVPDVEVISQKHGDFQVIESPGDTKFYLDQMRNEFIEMKMQTILKNNVSQMDSRAPTDSLTRILEQLTVLSRDTGIVKDLNIKDIDYAVEDYTERARLAKERGGIPGIATGIKYFDDKYPTGLAGGHLIVVIGWSGHGKSLFSTYLACKAWEQGFKPMIVSLEMSAEQCRDRVYTMLGSGEFSNSSMARGDIDIDRFQEWGEKRLKKNSDFIIISNEGMGAVTPLTVQGKIDQYKPDIVILDYQQLFDSSDGAGGGNETAKNKSISRDFKRLAISNNIPVINLSQATQSDTSDLETAPLIEQVAWSKSIQHDSDLAIAVHKPPHSNTMQVIARKSRHGDLFMFGIDMDIDRGVWTPNLDNFDFEDEDF